MNGLGGEWPTGVQLGSVQSLSTEFYQPLEQRHAAFARASASTSLRKTPIYSDGDRLAIYRIQENRAVLDGGLNVGPFGQASLGWAERSLGSVLDTGPDALLNHSQRLGRPLATLGIDTYDQPVFPTRRIKIDITYFDALRHND